MVAQTLERPLVDEGVVKAFFAAGMLFFLVSLTGGFLFSLQFLQHYPFPNIEWLSPGRVRMVHTNMVAYGFLTNVFLGAMSWAIPRLTGRPLLFGRFTWVIFWVELLTTPIEMDSRPARIPLPWRSCPTMYPISRSSLV